MCLSLTFSLLRAFCDSLLNTRKSMKYWDSIYDLIEQCRTQQYVESLYVIIIIKSHPDWVACVYKEINACANEQDITLFRLLMLQSLFLKRFLQFRMMLVNHWKDTGRKKETERVNMNLAAFWNGTKAWKISMLCYTMFLKEPHSKV